MVVVLECLIRLGLTNLGASLMNVVAGYECATSGFFVGSEVML